MASASTSMAILTAPRTPASAWALSPNRRPPLRSRLQRAAARTLLEAFEAHPILCVTTVLLFGGAVLTFPLLFLDARQIGGAPAWVGPFRFFFSMATYSGTILAFGVMMGPSRVFHRVGALISGVAVLELTLMVAQTARGERAFFNDAASWNHAVGITMGIAFTALWISSIFFTLEMFRRPMGAPGLASAARLSMVIALAGMALGFLMFLPTLAGPTEGGSGLGLVGWSMTGGDWRPAHFMGLHAIQVLPVFAWFLGRHKGLADHYQVTLVGVVSAGYACLMGVLAWQAIRAQPLAAPDALTFAALIVVLAGVASAVAAVLSHAASHGAERAAVQAEPWQPAPTGNGSSSSLSFSSFSSGRQNPLIPLPRLVDASLAGTDEFDPLPAMGPRRARAAPDTTVPMERPSLRLPPPTPLKGTVTLNPARASGRVARIRSAKQAALGSTPDQATELELRSVMGATVIT